MLINPEDPRYIPLGKMVNCFSKSINLFPYIVESIEILYKGTTLPGYFYYYKCRSTGNNYFNSSNTSTKIMWSKNLLINRHRPYHLLIPLLLSMAALILS